jgi:hypothetical protein
MGWDWGYPSPSDYSSVTHERLMNGNVWVCEVSKGSKLFFAITSQVTLASIETALAMYMHRLSISTIRTRCSVGLRCTKLILRSPLSEPRF